MWMLAWIPDAVLIYVVNLVLVAGIIGVVLSFFLLHRIVRWFPALAPYHLLVQIVSVVLLVGGVYFRGGYDTEASWRAKVKELEDKVSQIETQSNNLNKKLDEERKKKQKVRVEYYATVKTQIKEVEKQINADCKLDPKVNDLVNKAATNPEAKK